MSYILVIIAITALISIAGFTSEDFVNKMILWPARMDSPAEYHRFVSAGFVHADFMHLAFNMFSLYLFGQGAEYILSLAGPLAVKRHYAGTLILTMYVSGIIISSIPSFVKHRNNLYYRSLGASGAVAAIIFFCIYYMPWNEIGLVFLPFKIPGIVFGGLYLACEMYMARKGTGTVNHDAHMWGALYGLFFAFMADPTHGAYFVEMIRNPVWKF